MHHFLDVVVAVGGRHPAVLPAQFCHFGFDAMDAQSQADAVDDQHQRKGQDHRELNRHQRPTQTHAEGRFNAVRPPSRHLG